MMNYRRSALLALSMLIASATVVAGETPSNYLQHPEYPAFARKMIDEHGYTREQLDAIFGNAFQQQKILDAIAKPAEGKDWHEYRPIFMTAERINGGVEFWNTHQHTIERAAKQFGVDAEIIVALIGIETYYGRIAGSWRVIDALATLGFDYPPRQAFFRSELENFLLLVREESLNLHDVTGSYAGAMGGGQFMPSSYRNYAVDFDNDGQRNLWQSWPDIIGSVANYLSRFGWQYGEVIAVPAAAPEGIDVPLKQQGMQVFNAGELRMHGMIFSELVLNEQDIRLVALQNRDEMSWWIGLKNFAVINRYNRSPLYAMAAVELGRAIREQREKPFHPEP